MLNIREASPDDAQAIVDLIQALADYEKEPDAVKVRPEDILRHGFSERRYFECLLAEWDGALAGFALYFFNYSTWEGRPGIYLEDLFVKPEFRGRGIGKSLMVQLARVALANECSRFQWQVLDWNTPAIDFYESIGARNMREWYTYRLEGEALQNLAREAS